MKKKSGKAFIVFNLFFCVSSLIGMVVGQPTMPDLSRRLDTLERKVSGIHFESGQLEIGPISGQSCKPDVHRGLINARVTFTQPFKNRPKVTAGLVYLDIVGGTRVQFTVESVDKEGFQYTFTTWCDTNLYRGVIMWMATSNPQ